MVVEKDFLLFGRPSGHTRAGKAVQGGKGRAYVEDKGGASAGGGSRLDLSALRILSRFVSVKNTLER